jgi:hypothetical protein
MPTQHFFFVCLTFSPTRLSTRNTPRSIACRHMVRRDTQQPTLVKVGQLADRETRKPYPRGQVRLAHTIGCRCVFDHGHERPTPSDGCALAVALSATNRQLRACLQRQNSGTAEPARSLTRPCTHDCDSCHVHVTVALHEAFFLAHYLYSYELFFSMRERACVGSFSCTKHWGTAASS